VTRQGLAIGFVVSILALSGPCRSDNALPRGPLQHLYTSVVTLSGRNLKAWEVAYNALTALPNIPSYQREVEHYDVTIGESDKLGGIFIVSFELLNSHGKVGPGQPRLTHGFPWVEYYVRKSDYKIIGQYFGGFWM
jgi:hypothetical protein